MTRADQRQTQPARCSAVRVADLTLGPHDQPARQVADLLLFACRFKDKGLGFACGGSGSLFKTTDGGKSWKRDKVRTASAEKTAPALAEGICCT